jgi:hypothetical protein
MLRVDPARDLTESATTGIYAHALLPSGTVESVDIATLDAPSLLTWLRSRGGKNEWAESLVGTLLGHNKPIVDL